MCTGRCPSGITALRKKGRSVLEEAGPEITVEERPLSPSLLETLIRLSADWEAEGSCTGYRKNGREDIEGNRIFLAESAGEVLGYLFGHMEKADKASSVMPEGTPFFEVEELYVKPEHRRRGLGRQLFGRAEAAVSAEAELILLSTATKNWRAVLHFYLEELGMEFWSARLFKRLRGGEGPA